jgi:hypothetical protein
MVGVEDLTRERIDNRIVNSLDHWGWAKRVGVKWWTLLFNSPGSPTVQKRFSTVSSLLSICPTPILGPSPKTEVFCDVIKIAVKWRPQTCSPGASKMALVELVESGVDRFTTYSQDWSDLTDLQGSVCRFQQMPDTASGHSEPYMLEHGVE